MKQIRLTAKEIVRVSGGIAIIARQQEDSTFKVMAVRVTGLVGTPMGFSETAKN